MYDPNTKPTEILKVVC